jgi:hypothetical protein
VSNAPSIPQPRPDFGGLAPSVERSAALPFGATTEPEGTVVLHVKVLASTPQERLAVARVVTAQLADQRVGSKGITILVTDEAVTTELSSTTLIAAKIVADVKRTLGVP